MLFPLEQERVRYFRLTGTECPDRAAIHICEMSLQKSSRKGVIVMLAEVFERLERLFEGYVEKVKRAGCELLPTRMGMEDVFINSYHNLKFEGIPVLGQGTFFIF